MAHISSECRRILVGLSSDLVVISSEDRHNEYGPCFATNEYPRRAVDVIVSQSKALIEIFNTR